MTDRTEYTKGLRALADILDAHPEVPLPYHGREGTPLAIYHLNRKDETRAAFLASVRAFPGRKEKDANDGTYRVAATLHGVRVEVVAYRETVCERVVTGTREVTREVPDPDALAALPKTVVTETVEDVEWICQPLTADRTPVSA
jgi:hypothetical protein